MSKIYTASLNDRYIFKATTLSAIKSQASRLANKSFKPVDHMRVTSRDEEGTLEVLLFGRMSAKDGTKITRTDWIEKTA